MHFSEQTQEKKNVFYGKICIKACLEIEETQVVCCGHLQNNYFMLNSNNTIFHCGTLVLNTKGRKITLQGQRNWGLDWNCNWQTC